MDRVRSGARTHPLRPAVVESGLPAHRLLMSRIGNLQDFLEAVGPHQPVEAALAMPDAAELPIVPGELILEAEPDDSTPLEIATGMAPHPESVDLDAVTAVTRFPPRG